jgi:hypothetical protein
VHSDELGAVHKCSFDLNLVHQARNVGQDVAASQYLLRI